MTISDPFGSAKRRIDRAKTHILNLNKEIVAFLNGKPYAHAIEPDADGLNHLHKIKFTKTVPGSFCDIAADALENLRAALDQAGYAVAVATGKVSPRSAYFPVGDDIANLEGVIKRRCKDLPNQIISLFRSFEPYKGADNLIWALNKANNVNKHRLLVPAAFAIGQFDLKLRMTGPGGVVDPRFDREKNEIVFAVSGPGTKIQYNAKVSVCVAFDDIEGIEGSPAAHVLGDMHTEVRGIVSDTEAEARNMGLI